MEFQLLSKYSGTFPEYICTAYVDNLVFEEAACPAPDQSVSDISITSLKIDGTSGSSDNYEVLPVKHNQNPNTENPLYYTSLPMLIDIIDIATAYHLYVRKLCGDRHGARKKIVASMDRELIQAPHQENFDYRFRLPLYSSRKLSTGLAFAACVAFILTVKRAINIVAIPASSTIHHFKSI